MNDVLIVSHNEVECKGISDMLAKMGVAPFLPKVVLMPKKRLQGFRRVQ